MILTDEARKRWFFNRVFPEPNTGCWLWSGAIAGEYGYVHIEKRAIVAHKYSYMISRGEITPGLLVLHTCDNQLCVNPDHLYLGTQQQNMNDKVGRGRQARGTKHGMSKLNDAAVKEIRGGGLSLTKAMRKFGMGASNFYRIKHGKIWKHIA